MSTQVAEDFPLNPIGLTWDTSYEIAYFTPLTKRDMWIDVYGEPCALDSEANLDDLSDRQKTIWASRKHRLVRDSDGLTLFGRRGSYMDIDCSLARSITKYAVTGEW